MSRVHDTSFSRDKQPRSGRSSRPRRAARGARHTLHPQVLPQLALETQPAAQQEHQDYSRRRHARCRFLRRPYTSDRRPHTQRRRPLDPWRVNACCGLDTVNSRTYQLELITEPRTGEPEPFEACAGEIITTWWCQWSRWRRTARGDVY